MLLAPSALWWLLTAAAITAIFLTRRRIAVVEIPALEFWTQMLKYDTLGRWGRRLRRWLSLALHLLIVVLLVGALAEPVNPAYKNELLIVLDDSATMQTIEDDGRSRFDHAGDVVINALNQAPNDVRTTIVLAAVPPKILTNSETLARQVRAALRQRRPRDCPPDFDQALTLLHRLRRDESSSILVVSDRAGGAYAGVEWRRIGRTHPNIGIADVRPARDEPAVDIILSHRQMTPRTATVSLIALNQTTPSQSPDPKRGVNRTTAQANIVLRDSPAVVRIPVNFQTGDAFTVRVEPDDAFMLDNTAYAVWPALTQTRLRLVTSDNIYLEAALDQPDATLEIVSPNAWRPNENADVTILDAPSIGPNKPAPGRYLVFGGADPFGLCRRQAPLRDLAPSQWTADHALIRDLDPLQWRISETAGLRPPKSARPVIEADGVPLIFTIELPGAPDDPRDDFRAVYIDFDLSSSNLARRADLPVLIWCAIDYLLDKRPEDARAAHSAGSPLIFPAQSSASAIVIDPAGRELHAWYDDDRQVLPFTEYAGIYELESADNPSPRAVNYSAGDELNENAATATNVTLPERRPRPPIWIVLAAAAGLLLLLEALLNHRGVLNTGWT